MKVLIVDDVPLNLRLLRAMLEAENIEVTEAPDGAEALAVLEHEEVDAIISDILMPRVDGYRLCQEVRKRAQWQQLPFIFYSATYTSEGDEKLCYDLGGDKYLRKPAARRVLLDALSEATTSARNRLPRRATLNESDVTRQYSERLVAKLEQKNQELTLRTEQLEQAKSELQQANAELDRRVQQRTAELEVANQELESFSYSVSHDLRSPLNHICGYIDLLLRDCSDKLDETNLEHLKAVRSASRRMGELIHALLEISRLGRGTIERRPVDLSRMAAEVMAELKTNDPARVVQVEIAPNLIGRGDRRLLRVVLSNLLGNAWKYSRKRLDARVEFGRIAGTAADTYFVRDNGAGFDMTYVNKLFRPFQRLHGASEFEGNGIGLATVRRILWRHHGIIRAESVERQGATFYFTLGGAAADEPAQEEVGQEEEKLNAG